MGNSFRDNLICLETVDSTNLEAFRREQELLDKLRNEAKANPETSTEIDAKDLVYGIENAKYRLAVTSEYQSAGRGRSGRSFQSDKSMGLYLSALENEIVSPDITAFVAVCVCRVLRKMSGLDCKIKWPNDIQIDGKKLCGILCELREHTVVIGIGINLYQEDFGELGEIACSLAQYGVNADKEMLRDELLKELDVMIDNYNNARAEYLRYFRENCCSLDKDIWMISGEEKTPAHSIDINDDFSLRVQTADGEIKDIAWGEISLRLRS